MQHFRRLGALHAQAIVGSCCLWHPSALHHHKPNRSKHLDLLIGKDRVIMNIAPLLPSGRMYVKYPSEFFDEEVPACRTQIQDLLNRKAQQYSTTKLHCAHTSA